MSCAEGWCIIGRSCQIYTHRAHKTGWSTMRKLPRKIQLKEQRGTINIYDAKKR
jgi:hypothetical protein